MSTKEQKAAIAAALVMLKSETEETVYLDKEVTTAEFALLINVFLKNNNRDGIWKDAYKTDYTGVYLTEVAALKLQQMLDPFMVDPTVVFLTNVSDPRGKYDNAALRLDDDLVSQLIELAGGEASDVAATAIPGLRTK